MSDISPQDDPDAAAPDRAVTLQIAIQTVELQIRIMKTELVNIQIRLPALAVERELQWRRVSEAGFLSDAEKRVLLGLPALPMADVEGEGADA